VIRHAQVYYDGDVTPPTLTGIPANYLFNTTMAEQAELTFARNLFATISAQPVVYADDYQAPPHDTLRRIQILPVRLDNFVVAFDQRE
jgi:hypothetical protein